MLSSRLARVSASIATSLIVAAGGLATVGAPAAAAPPAGGYTGASTTPAAWPVSFTVSGGNVLDYTSTVTIGCAPFFFDIYFASIPINPDGSFAAAESAGSGFVMEVSGTISDGGSASGVQDLDSDIGCGSADTPWAATLTDPEPPTTTTTTTTLPPTTTTTTTLPPTTTTTTTLPPTSTTSSTLPDSPTTSVPPSSTTAPTAPTTTAPPPPSGPAATISATAVAQGGVVTVRGHWIRAGGERDRDAVPHPSRSWHQTSRRQRRGHVHVDDPAGRNGR